MKYDGNFTRHLRDIKNDTIKKVDRAADDKKAYNNYRSLYPEPTHDHKGVPLWNNSDAQHLLKEDITAGKYQPRDKK
jgi:hypothetical protein